MIPRINDQLVHLKKRVKQVDMMSWSVGLVENRGSTVSALSIVYNPEMTGQWKLPQEIIQM